MRKATLLGISSLLGAGALGLIGYGIAHPTVTIRIAQDDLQRRVDARLPIEGSRVGVAYEVTRALVTLRPEGRIGVEADVTASALNRRADMTLAGSGVLVYRNGAFFLDAFKVEQAIPRAVDEALVEEDPAPNGRLAEAIGRIGLKDRAAKALETAGVKDGAAFLTARKEAVVAAAKEKGGAMLAETLQTHPVYRLKDSDMRQSLAKVALQDARVEDGAVVVELNVMRLAGWIVLYGVALLLCVLAFVGFALAFGAGPAMGLGFAVGMMGS